MGRALRGGEGWWRCSARCWGIRLWRANRSNGGGEPLSKRQRETLELLLAGNAEKQIAARLNISRHTVHVYVKSLYKRFDVNSRPELLAKWVRH
jgi:DNA-binding CsgD family transcriptional regulator